MFSQRRVNIGDLIAERTLGIREEERKRAFDIVQGFASANDQEMVKLGEVTKQ
jgi:hypothetical protein